VFDHDGRSSPTPDKPRSVCTADVTSRIPGDDRTTVRFDGHDRYDRPKWVIEGKTVGELDIGLVCVLDTDDHGRVTVFITIY